MFKPSDPLVDEMGQARQTLESQVLERAAKDSHFRDHAEEDPRGTIAQNFGIQIPADMTVEVLEETPSTVYLMLPLAAVQRGQELSGEELESVASGWTGQTECGTCGANCLRALHTACHQ